MRSPIFILALCLLTSNILVAQERGEPAIEEVFTPIKRSDVELLHKINDGTPPPPKVPVVVTPPGQVQRSQIYVTEGRTVTMIRVKPSSAVRIPKPEPAPSKPHREPTEAEIRQWQEEIKKHTFFSLSATVYDHDVTFLGWNHEGKRYFCWSNVDFTHVSGVGNFKVRGHHYSLFMMVGLEDSEYQRTYPDQWPGLPPEMPSWPPQFEMVGEDPEDEAALSSIIALHELYAIEHEELAKAYEGRERYRKEREAWLKENPPKPSSTVIYYWPSKGGDIREELPAPTMGFVRGGQGKARTYRRASQGEIPTSTQELAELEARAEKAARELDALENVGSDEKSDPRNNAIEAPNLRR